MGARAGFCRADISKKEDAAALLDAALEFFGGTVDVILHNAGVISTYDFLVIGPEEVERLFNINVLGVSHMLQEGMKQMIKQDAVKLYEAKEAEFANPEQIREIERVVLLKIID